MGADQNFDWQNAAASAIDWWREAGVDTLIDEAPRNWLVAPLSRATAPPAEAVTEFAALPDTLAAFTAWRTGTDAPEAAWPGDALPAQGAADAKLMVLIDMPERDDAQTGVLMSGAAGRLFDRMLAAIGHSRETIYLAPLCAKRPPAGRIAPEDEERLGEIARHHVALVQPAQVLLMGNAPSRAVLGADLLPMRGILHSINLEEPQSPGGPSGAARGATEQALACYHPRFLLERPERKAEAWKDLQLLIGHTGRCE